MLKRTIYWPLGFLCLARSVVRLMKALGGVLQGLTLLPYIDIAVLETAELFAAETCDRSQERQKCCLARGCYSSHWCYETAERP
jgi:hypothetical protein